MFLTTNFVLLLAVGAAAQFPDITTTALPPALRYTAVVTGADGDTEHGCCRVNNDEAVRKSLKLERLPATMKISSFVGAV